MPLLLALLLQDIAEVSVHRTPGKPMMFHEKGKPAEEIAAKKDGDTYRLTVRVNVPRKNVEKYTEEKAELTQDEWESILKIVADESLLDWKPKNEKRAHDWGSAGFSLKGKRENTQVWFGEPDHPPDKLFKRLSELARKKIEKLPLYYLTAID